MRVGDKLIDPQKIYRLVDKTLELRGRGLSQQEVAQRLGVDRTFISRLEKAGEVRKGQRVAVVGFPLGNKQELLAVLEETGVDFGLIMTDEERRSFLRQKSGEQLLNEIMEIIGRVRACDLVVIIGSNYRIRLAEALLGKDVVGLEIGKSPITGDVMLDPQVLSQLLSSYIAQ